MGTKHSNSLKTGKWKHNRWTDLTKPHSHRAPGKACCFHYKEASPVRLGQGEVTGTTLIILGAIKTEVSMAIQSPA